MTLFGNLSLSPSVCLSASGIAQLETFDFAFEIPLVAQSAERERRCSDVLIFPTHRSVPEWRVISDDSGRLEASTNIPYVLIKVSRQDFYVPFPGHHFAFLRYFSEACSRETLQPPAWDHSCIRVYASLSFARETICDSLSCKHTFAFVCVQFVFKETYMRKIPIGYTIFGLNSAKKKTQDKICNKADKQLSHIFIFVHVHRDVQISLRFCMFTRFYL